MLITIPDILSPEQVAQARKTLAGADWVDGRVTAGYQAQEVKRNLQISEGSPVSVQLGEMILAGLARSPRFMSAALPLRVFPPMFNSYSGGQTFGTHVDTAIRQVSTTGQRIRTDLSATLFLTPPDEYDGGELVVEDAYGAHSVKLPAGHMVLYPATSLHRVEPVTRGARVSSFFWIQSMVREDSQRTLLFDLDTAIQRLATAPASPEVKASGVQLTGVYHNLLRQWAEM
jgi:PKHD-type hydroxylase